MYALKSGAVPVVRATGGVDDTIVQFNPRTKARNGFKFSPYEPAAFIAAIRQAVDLLENRASWDKIMAKGMGADFSWESRAGDYAELYRSLKTGQGAFLGIRGRSISLQLGRGPLGGSCNPNLSGQWDFLCQ